MFEFKLSHQDTDDITLDYGEFTQFGDFYYQDGSWGRYHPSVWSEDTPDGVKIIGIVFKVGVFGIQVAASQRFRLKKTNFSLLSR